MSSKLMCVALILVAAMTSVANAGGRELSEQDVQHYGALQEAAESEALLDQDGGAEEETSTEKGFNTTIGVLLALGLGIIVVAGLAAG